VTSRTVGEVGHFAEHLDRASGVDAAEAAGEDQDERGLTVLHVDLDTGRAANGPGPPLLTLRNARVVLAVPHERGEPSPANLVSKSHAMRPRDSTLGVAIA
jgi:hypothetical protein